MPHIAGSTGQASPIGTFVVRAGTPAATPEKSVLVASRMGAARAPPAGGPSHAHGTAAAAVAAAAAAAGAAPEPAAEGGAAPYPTLGETLDTGRGAEEHVPYPTLVSSASDALGAAAGEGGSGEGSDHGPSGAGLPSDARGSLESPLAADKSGYNASAGTQLPSWRMPVYTLQVLCATLYHNMTESVQHCA